MFTTSDAINCKHWEENVRTILDVGTCDRIRGDGLDIVEEEVHEYHEGNGPLHLDTDADFGCVLWEGKS